MHLKIRLCFIIIISSYFFLLTCFIVQDISKTQDPWETNKLKETNYDFEDLKFNIQTELPQNYWTERNFTKMAQKWKTKIRSKSLKVSRSCLLDPLPAILDRPKFDENSFCYSPKTSTESKIVIAIFSDTADISRRELVRGLLQALKNHPSRTMEMEYFFVVGLTSDKDTLREIQTFNDILFLDILGTKQLRGFKSFAVYQHLIQTLCPNFDMFLQLEDSVFIIPQKFFEFLSKLSAEQKENLYAGFPIFDHRTRLEKARKDAIFRDSVPSLKRFPPHIHRSFTLISKKKLNEILNCHQSCFDRNHAAYIGYCLKGSAVLT